MTGHPFYRSVKWRKCRAAYYAYRHGLCERCGSVGEIVHHKIYLTRYNINDPNVTLSFDNLELVCRKCHGSEHGAVVTTQGYHFTADGDLVYSPPYKGEKHGKHGP